MCFIMGLFLFYCEILEGAKQRMHMKTVLIADDEKNICKLLKNLIDWETLGLHFIGEVYNGKDALAFIESEKPDIVITDIRMPGMDGLQLLEAAHERYADEISFIIISGHKNFDYAYKAIKFGAVDFLLKPINQSELNASLKRLLDLMTDVSPFSEAPMSQDYIVRKQLLVNLVHDVFNTEDLSVADFNKEYRYRFEDELFQIGIIYIDNCEQLGNIKEHICAQLAKQFLVAAREQCFDVDVYTKNQYIYFILNYNEGKQKAVKKMLQLLYDEMEYSIRSYRFLKLTIGIGTEGEIKHILKSVKQAEKAIRSRAIVGAEKLIDFADFNDLPIYEYPKVSDYTAEIEKAQELLDKDSILQICERYFHEVISKTEKMSYAAVDMLEMQLRFIVIGAVKLHASSLSDQYMKRMNVVNLTGCCEKEELLEKFQEIISLEFEYLLSMKETQDSKIIKTVKQYIAENYDRPISLEDVSKDVFLSPAYLGILFKKETGELFSQYISKFRMEKARELLRESNYSIKEIANKLGYKDIRNFSKLFKNIVGVKPTEYRKLYRLDTE